MPTIWDGIIIGGAGGAIAGLMVVLIQFGAAKYKERRDRETVYAWLKGKTSNEAGKQFRSTRTIASWTNLTEERVRYVRSVDDRIFLSTGEKEDMWGIYEHTPRSMYEEPHTT